MAGGNCGCAPQIQPIIWIPGAVRAFDAPVAFTREKGPNAVTAPVDAALPSIADAFMVRHLMATKAVGMKVNGPYVAGCSVAAVGALAGAEVLLARALAMGSGPEE